MALQLQALIDSSVLHHHILGKLHSPVDLRALQETCRSLRLALGSAAADAAWNSALQVGFIEQLAT